MKMKAPFRNIKRVARPNEKEKNGVDSVNIKITIYNPAQV
jgi:hypothetical protein